MRYLFAAFLLCCLHVAFAQADVVRAALRFTSTLSTEQRAKAQYAFTNDEHFNWHFIPKERNGISLNELNAEQKAAAMDLVKTGLSQEGFRKANEIIQLEIVLKALENRAADDHFRDPGKYFFTIFGTPAENEIWGWRVEGHHLSFTFSSDKNHLVSGTPGFMGSNPGTVREGPEKGKQILKEETDKAFELLHSLSKTELQKAVVANDAPNEIFTAASRKAMIDDPQGITYAQMKPQQQKVFIELLSIYINRYTKLFADDMLKEIHAAGLDKLRFGWAGSHQPEVGKAYYYRITGPTIIIEFDNSQNNANHIHTVVRDLKRDFGGDELWEHYKQSHKTN